MCGGDISTYSEQQQRPTVQHHNTMKRPNMPFAVILTWPVDFTTSRLAVETGDKVLPSSSTAASSHCFNFSLQRSKTVSSYCKSLVWTGFIRLAHRKSFRSAASQLNPSHWTFNLPANTLQSQLITIGAAKLDETEIFELATLTFPFWCNHDWPGGLCSKLWSQLWGKSFIRRFD